MCLQHLLFAAAVIAWSRASQVKVKATYFLLVNWQKCTEVYQGKKIIMAWLLRLNTLQPALNSILSVSRAKTMGTSEGRSNENLW